MYNNYFEPHRREWNKRGNPIPEGVKAWVKYAEGYKSYLLSEDAVLGPAWYDWGKGLRGLLNGDLGDLDAGTIDCLIHDTLIKQGFED